MGNRCYTFIQHYDVLARHLDYFKADDNSSNKKRKQAEQMLLANNTKIFSKV
jgi:hypothetical protein